MKERMKKYDAIMHYLKNDGGSQVTLTFTQFNELLLPGNGLPRTTREITDWWTNNYRHPEEGAYGWLDVGYEAVVINSDKEYVVFDKLVKSN